MIPATHPYIARYKHETPGPDNKIRTTYTERPVIAWDDDGTPLVAGDRRLTRADHWTNYDGIESGLPPVVATVPADNWRAEYKNPDGTGMTWPLVAWAIRADGTTVPLDSDGDGWCQDATENSNFVRIYHQSDAPAVPATEQPTEGLS